MPNIDKIRINNTDYDIYGLGGDVLPIGTEVEIEENTTIPVGWEEVNDKYAIYSTTQKCIGRWIDGKPLYRKVYTLSTIPSSNTDLFSVADLEIDTMVKLYGFAKTANSMQFPIPSMDSDSNYSVIFKSANNIRGRMLSGGGDITAVHIILEYTKTTDTTDMTITKKIQKVEQSVPPALLDEYSTTEKIVGTWTDGKPIYRKVVSGTFTTKNQQVNITGVDNILNAWGYIVMNENVKMVFGQCVMLNDKSDGQGSRAVIIYGTQVRLDVDDQYVGKTFEVVVEYTKQ